MKFSKAMKLLEGGAKVRRVTWDKNKYIYFGKDNILTDENGKVNTDWLSYRLNIYDEWEEYIEPQEPIEETEENNCDIQNRLSMILENQAEIKAGVQAILKWFAIETKEEE